MDTLDPARNPSVRARKAYRIISVVAGVLLLLAATWAAWGRLRTSDMPPGPGNP